MWQAREKAVHEVFIAEAEELLEAAKKAQSSLSSLVSIFCMKLRTRVRTGKEKNAVRERLETAHQQMKRALQQMREEKTAASLAVALPELRDAIEQVREANDDMKGRWRGRWQGRRSRGVKEAVGVDWRC